MRLILNKEYLSIKNINDIELPDFTVLTGLNGSGKTQILNAILNGTITCDNIPKQSISLLSYENLISSQLTSVTVNKECEKFLKIIHTLLRDTYQKHLTHINADINHYILQENIDKPIWSISKSEVSSNLWNNISEFKKDMFKDVFNNESFKKFSHSNHLIQSIKRFGIVNSQKGFHIPQYVDVIESQTLESISQLFNNYNNLGMQYALNEFKKSKRHLTRDEFITEYESNNPKPWVTFNNCIKRLRNTFKNSEIFNFEITNPESPHPLYNGNIARLYDIDRKILTNYEQLSSGEKVIFTLIGLIFASEKGSIPPQLILLDEIDATLHPSMIKAMLQVINGIFIEQKTKVIMASHSPTTIALVDETAIHVVNHKQTEEKIVKATKNEALSILTEGYATMNDLLQIGDTNKEKIIISEGMNYNYLQKAKEYFDTNDEIEILSCNLGGTGEIKASFNFLRQINRTKEIFFVWDWDYRVKEERDENDNVKKDEKGQKIYIERDLSGLYNSSNDYNKVFIFEENIDSESSRGIENLFSKDSVKGYSGEFNEKGPKNKKYFERYIIDNADAKMFHNFKPLFDFILN